jgi:carboxyl-terminal processing protease
VRRKIVYTLIILPVTFVLWSFSTDYFQVSKQLEIFASVYREVNTYYVDDVNPGKLFKTGVDAMLRTLDPYTNFYTESEIEDYKIEHVSADYGGVGISSLRVGDSVFVYDVYEGYAAQRADVRAGDVILSANGKSLKGLTGDEIDGLMKGQSGTSITLVLARTGESQPIEKKITREEIKVKNVSYFGMINDSTGYIKLDKFLQDCYKETREALVELQKNPNMTQLVFDLRGNGGGLLEESVRILNLFTEKGQLLVTQKGRIAGSNNVYKGESDPIAPNVRVAVLIDKSSASASEITAGNFQDVDRGVVFGQRSYGKGLVQQTRTLTYNCQMKLTVAKYFTASGRCVQTKIYTYNSSETSAYEEVADSLIKPFKTKNGRTVFDGSAIYPDVFVKLKDTSNIARSLYNKMIIFDYASYYRTKHSSIDSLGDFKLSDADYNDFINYVLAKNIDYSTQTELAFNDLLETSKLDKYYASANKEIDLLGSKLKHDHKADLLAAKEEIKALIKKEIVGRYYFQTGKNRFMMKNDPVLLQALNTISNATLYNSILKGEGDYKVIGKKK